MYTKHNFLHSATKLKASVKIWEHSFVNDTAINNIKNPKFENTTNLTVGAEYSVNFPVPSLFDLKDGSSKEELTAFYKSAGRTPRRGNSKAPGNSLISPFKMGPDSCHCFSLDRTQDLKNRSPSPPFLSIHPHGDSPFPISVDSLSQILNAKLLFCRVHNSVVTWPSLSGCPGFQHLKLTIAELGTKHISIIQIQRQCFHK